MANSDQQGEDGFSKVEISNISERKGSKGASLSPELAAAPDPRANVASAGSTSWFLFGGIWRSVSSWMQRGRGQTQCDLCGCCIPSLEGWPGQVSVEEGLGFFYAQQARLLGFFALNHWRVRTVVHALSATRAAPNLALVRCVSRVNEDSPARHPEELGGFSPQHNTVWLCGNRLWSPLNFRRVLLHELIHAFDFSRAHLDFSDCRHVACTEVRAVNLSEQCSLWASRRLSPEALKEPLDGSALLADLAHRLESLESRAAQTKRRAKEAAERALLGASAKDASSPEAAVARRAALVADAAEAEARRARRELEEARKELGEERIPATAAAASTPLWAASKRNACVARQALLSVRQLPHCARPGLAVRPPTPLFGKQKEVF